MEFHASMRMDPVPSHIEIVHAFLEKQNPAVSDSRVMASRQASCLPGLSFIVHT
jgi:hypothetical protein